MVVLVRLANFIIVYKKVVVNLGRETLKIERGHISLWEQACFL